MCVFMVFLSHIDIVTWECEGQNKDLPQCGPSKLFGPRPK
jgi:hypothetical protein